LVLFCALTALTCYHIKSLSGTFAQRCFATAAPAGAAPVPPPAGPAAAAAAAPERTYGGLKDSDRIFTNLYGDGDAFLKGALKRVRLGSLTFMTIWLCLTTDGVQWLQ